MKEKSGFFSRRNVLFLLFPVMENFFDTVKLMKFQQ